MPLLVGLIERFNPAVQQLLRLLTDDISIYAIDARRMSAASSRITDVDVVTDLMVHDLDIALALMKSPVVGLSAHGVRTTVTEGNDHVTALLSFANGSLASLIASRITQNKVRDQAAMAAVFEAERSQVVFNLATRALLYSFFNPSTACRVNLDVALALGELLRGGAYDRLVHVSSSEVYGSSRSERMDEDHPLHPTTPYAAGKAAADLLLSSYCQVFDLDILILRPFNNYGPVRTMVNGPRSFRRPSDVSDRASRR